MKLPHRRASLPSWFIPRQVRDEEAHHEGNESGAFSVRRPDIVLVSYCSKCDISFCICTVLHINLTISCVCAIIVPSITIEASRGTADDLIATRDPAGRASIIGPDAVMGKAGRHRALGHRDVACRRPGFDAWYIHSRVSDVSDGGCDRWRRRGEPVKSAQATSAGAIGDGTTCSPEATLRKPFPQLSGRLASPCQHCEIEFAPFPQAICVGSTRSISEHGPREPSRR